MATNLVAACRTARGHEHGTALTFMIPDEERLLSQLEQRVGRRAADPLSIKPYKFRMSEVEGFRYRVKVTKSAHLNIGILTRIGRTESCYKSIK